MKALAALILAALLIPAPDGAAQGRRRHRPVRPAPAAATADQPPPAGEPAKRAGALEPGSRGPVVPEELAQWFPRDVSYYLELDDVAGALDASGAAVPLRQFLSWAASAIKAAGVASKSRGVSSAELKTLLSATGAFAEFPAPVVSQPAGAARSPKQAARPLQVGILRMRSPQALEKFRAKTLIELEPRLKSATVVSVAVAAGHEIQIFAVGKAEESPAYAVVGRHMVLGTVAGIATTLEGIGRPRKETLAARPDFAAASTRLGERRALFGLYVPPKGSPAEIAASPDETGHGMTSDELQAIHEARQRSDRQLGYDALESIAFWARGGEGGLTVRVLFNLDAEKSGLLPRLAGMPSIALRAAEFVPGEAELFWSAGADLPEIATLMAEPHSPMTTLGMMFGLNGAELLPEIDKTLISAHGLSLKGDILGAFGAEMAMAKGIVPTPAGSTQPPARYAIAVAEVRRPDVLRMLIQRYNELFPPESEDRARLSEYRGAEVWRFGDRAWAMVDGFAIGGRAKSVELALDAHATGRSLGSSASFAQTARSAPKSLGVAIVASPSYVASMVSGPGGGAGLEAVLSAGGVTALVSREPTGLLLDLEIRPAVFDAVSRSVDAIRTPAGETSAVSSLRVFALAQANFHASENRYGTIEELVAAEMLDRDWTQDTVRNGYRFTASVSPGGAPASEFQMAAVPVRYGEAGRRSFVVTHDFVIHAADRQGDPATRDDPPYEEESEDDWDYESPSLTALVPLVDVLYALGSPTYRNELTLEALHVLFEAQQRYTASFGRLGSVEEMQKAGILDGGFTGFPDRNGYHFAFTSATGKDGRGDSFAVTATPTSYTAGSLSFYISPAAGVRAADKAGVEATAADPKYGDDDEGDEGDGALHGVDPDAS